VIIIASNSPFTNTSLSSFSPEDTQKIVYEYLSVLSLLLVPRIAIANLVYTTTNYFSDKDGWIPYPASIIAVTIVGVITVVLAYLSSKFLNKHIYEQYAEHPDKMSIYMWFNKIIICIPIIVSLIAGSFILYQSFVLESEIDSWNGLGSNSLLEKRVRYYYLTVLQKVAVCIILAFLLILLVYCIASVLRSPLLIGGALIGSTTESVSHLKGILSAVFNGILAAACLGFFVLAGLSFAGMLFGNNPILGKIIGTIAMALASALLKSLFAKLLGDLLRSLLGFKGGSLFKKKGGANSKQNNKGEGDDSEI
jgi:ABC-type multidrug transport system fused ATPase/permease subunit